MTSASSCDLFALIFTFHSAATQRVMAEALTVPQNASDGAALYIFRGFTFERPEETLRWRSLSFFLPFVFFFPFLWVFDIRILHFPPYIFTEIGMMGTSERRVVVPPGQGVPYGFVGSSAHRIGRCRGKERVNGIQNKTMAYAMLWRSLDVPTSSLNYHSLIQAD